MTVSSMASVATPARVATGVAAIHPSTRIAAVSIAVVDCNVVARIGSARGSRSTESTVRAACCLPSSGQVRVADVTLEATSFICHPRARIAATTIAVVNCKSAAGIGAASDCRSAKAAARGATCCSPSRTLGSESYVALVAACIARDTRARVATGAIAVQDRHVFARSWRRRRRSDRHLILGRAELRAAEVDGYL